MKTVLDFEADWDAEREQIPTLRQPAEARVKVRVLTIEKLCRRAYAMGAAHQIAREEMRPSSSFFHSLFKR